MKAKFLGAESKKYTKQDGTSGVEHTLSLHDGEGVRVVRCTPEMARDVAGIPVMADVVVRFGFAAGRFGQHFATVVGLDLDRAAKSA